MTEGISTLWGSSMEMDIDMFSGLDLDDDPIRTLCILETDIGRFFQFDHDRSEFFLETLSRSEVDRDSLIRLELGFETHRNKGLDTGMRIHILLCSISFILSENNILTDRCESE